MMKCWIKKMKRSMAGCAMIVTVFMLGFMSQTMYETVKRDKPESYESSIGLFTIEDVLLRMENSDQLEDTIQGELDWLYYVIKNKMDSPEVLEQMERIDYKIHLTDALSNIPVEDQTTTVRQQLFQGADELVIDYSKKIIWVNYRTPVDNLVSAILAIQ